MHSEPHGDCPVCPLITAEWRSDCPHCHGTGRVCPGGEVREAVYVVKARHRSGTIEVRIDARHPSFFICRACGCVVDAGSVHD